MESHAAPGDGADDQLRNLVRQLPDAVVVAAAGGRLLFVNPAAEEMLGRPASELVGREVDFPLAPGELHEVGLPSPGAAQRIAEVRSADVDWDGRPAYVASLRDVTERKRREDQGREDPLTGLANRRVLMEELAAAIERAQAGWPGALLLVDIDGFKEVNDALGHVAGDKVLAELADRLRAVVRPGDLLARYGGDELAIIPARATIADAQWIGERLRASTEGYAVDGGPGSISLSVGIVPIDGGLDPEGALVEADRALYEAKRRGRNRVVLRGPEPASSDA